MTQVSWNELREQRDALKASVEQLAGDIHAVSQDYTAVRARLRDVRDQASELQELLKGIPAIAYLVTDLVNQEWAWAIHHSKKKAEHLCAALLVDPLTLPSLPASAPQPEDWPVNADVETAIEDIRQALDWLLFRCGHPHEGEIAMQRAMAVHALNRLRCYTRPASAPQQAETLVAQIRVLASRIEDGSDAVQAELGRDIIDLIDYVARPEPASAPAPQAPTRCATCGHPEAWHRVCVLASDHPDGLCTCTVYTPEPQG